jgi:hypothetical protein
VKGAACEKDNRHPEARVLRIDAQLPRGLAFAVRGVGQEFIFFAKIRPAAAFADLQMVPALRKTNSFSPARGPGMPREFAGGGSSEAFCGSPPAHQGTVAIRKIADKIARMLASAAKALLERGQEILSANDFLLVQAADTSGAFFR